MVRDIRILLGTAAVIVMRKAPGCKVGRTVTAKGRFWDCDYFEWGEVCWNAVLEEATGSCK
jgi:hypothetical protein